MTVHHLVLTLGAIHLPGHWAAQSLVLAYVSPDQILPLTSALGAVVGVLLMFWHRVVALLRKGWRLLAQQRSRSGRTDAPHP